MKNDYVAKLIAEIRRFHRESPSQSAAHKIDHLLRVRNRALQLAKQYENVDIEVLEMSALLHDVDQPHDQKSYHVRRSIEKAKELMRRIQYPEDRLQRVLEVMYTHSSEEVRSPSSVEAKILIDADKLDGLGALGIVRVFVYCGQQGMTSDEAVDWYKKKIKKAMPTVQTPLGKRIVAQQLKYVMSFLERYRKEKNKIL